VWVDFALSEIKDQLFDQLPTEELLKLMSGISQDQSSLTDPNWIVL
jgi:hypothetical protein